MKIVGKEEGKSIFALLFVVVALPLCAASISISCSSHTVSFPPFGHIGGTLCIPNDGITTVRTVILLVPGATYNQVYWDFQYQPNTYNFRLAVNNAGYATFTVDRLGTGASSKPLAATVTTILQAAAMSTVVAALRAGSVGGRCFCKVIIGGHSVGSAVTILEAATFQDVDGVLLTGISHRLNAAAVVVVLASMYPVLLAPPWEFVLKGYDPTYLTTIPGTRQGDFYYSATTNPAVVAADEASKDVFSITEAPDTIGVAVLSDYSSLITAPVLLVIGQQDFLFCDPILTNNCATNVTFAEQEAPYYSTSDFQVYMLANSGHDLNLATNTQVYQQVAIDWLNRHNFASVPASCGC